MPNFEWRVLNNDEMNVAHLRYARRWVGLIVFIADKEICPFKGLIFRNAVDFTFVKIDRFVIPPPVDGNCDERDADYRHAYEVVSIGALF